MRMLNKQSALHNHSMDTWQNRCCLNSQPWIRVLQNPNGALIKISLSVPHNNMSIAKWFFMKCNVRETSCCQGTSVLFKLRQEQRALIFKCSMPCICWHLWLYCIKQTALFRWIKMKEHLLGPSSYSVRNSSVRTPTHHIINAKRFWLPLHCTSKRLLDCLNVIPY